MSQFTRHGAVITDVLRWNELFKPVEGRTISDRIGDIYSMKDKTPGMPV